MPRKRNLAALNLHIGVFDFRNLGRMDWILVVLTSVLITAGLINLYSATFGSASGLPQFDADQGWWQSVAGLMNSWVGRQALHFLGGILLALLVVSIDYRVLVAMGPLFYVLVIALLTVVLVWGRIAGGGQRWLVIGGMNLQPSEFMKPALVYMLAWYLSRLGPRIRRLPWFVLAFIMTLVPMGLVAVQPSLSASLALFPIVCVMLFVSGARIWHFALMGFVGLLPVALVAMQVLSYQHYLNEMDTYETAVRESEAYPGPEPTPFDDRDFPLGVKLRSYQLERILTFLDPERDPADKGYQSIQMRITVGSGQLAGKGFAQGTQTHLSFLPVYHTDLIFALLAEEWGFTGAVTILALLLAFLLRGTAVAGMCVEPSGALVAAGCVAVLAFHSLANISITVGLLPITGMPLPFLSYGGSFCITTLLCVGSIMGVYVRRKQFV